MFTVAADFLLPVGHSPVALAAAFVVGGIAVGVAVWSMGTTRGLTEVMRFRMDGPHGSQLPFSQDFAISPDGTHMVYRGPNPSGVGSLFYLRQLDQLESTPLRGTENWVQPFFSPNGESIGFHSQAGYIERVSIFGGVPQRIGRLQEVPVGAAWGEDGDIIVGTTRGRSISQALRRGEPEALTFPDEGNHAWPSVIPGRRAVALRHRERAVRLRVCSA